MLIANRHDVVEIRVHVGLFGPLQGRRLVWGERVLNVREGECVVVDRKHLIRATFSGVADRGGLVIWPVNEHALSNLQVALERWILRGGSFEGLVQNVVKAVDNCLLKTHGAVGEVCARGIVIDVGKVGLVDGEVIVKCRHDEISGGAERGENKLMGGDPAEILTLEVIHSFLRNRQ